ncbi:uncharacterized protein VTP21DRAFT_10800 [Calcarisporiella thermophila]|uniref:uncharacterized protein n=1 Tax=Calcarisporiella thermophila TaxID=911321 RepID=UPI003743BE9C
MKICTLISLATLYFVTFFDAANFVQANRILVERQIKINGNNSVEGNQQIGENNITNSTNSGDNSGSLNQNINAGNVDEDAEGGGDEVSNQASNQTQVRSTGDTYRNFAALMEACKQDNTIKYSIDAQERGGNMIVLGIHGGNIELGTSEIVRAIANYADKPQLPYYLFESHVSPSNNQRRYNLHITSTRFDEPNAIEMTTRKTTVISIHGAANETNIVYMGGLDEDLSRKVGGQLRNANLSFKFEVNFNPPRGLTGKEPNNIVNKGRTRKGTQLEITRGMRRRLTRNPTDLSKFALAIRKALDQ